MGLLVDAIEAAKRGDAKAAGQALVQYLEGYDIGYQCTDHDEELEAHIRIERRPIPKPAPEAD